MSFVKATVDKLQKGYDIRLRPDFGGKYLFGDEVYPMLANNKSHTDSFIAPASCLIKKPLIPVLHAI